MPCICDSIPGGLRAYLAEERRQPVNGAHAVLLETGVVSVLLSEALNAACSLFDMDAIDSPEYVVPSGPSELAAAVFSELGQLRCDGPCESASAAAVGNGCFCGFLDDLTDSQNGLVPKQEFALQLSATKRFSPPKIDEMYAAYAENKLLEQSEGEILNLQKEGERLAEKARSGSLEDMQAFNQNVQQRTALMDEIDRQLSRAVNAE